MLRAPPSLGPTVLPPSLPPPRRVREYGVSIPSSSSRGVTATQLPPAPRAFMKHSRTWRVELRNSICLDFLPPALQSALNVTWKEPLCCSHELDVNVLRPSSATRPLTQPRWPSSTAPGASQCGKGGCPLHARLVGKGLLKRTNMFNGVVNTPFKNGGLFSLDVLLGLQIPSLMPHLHLDLSG